MLYVHLKLDSSLNLVMSWSHVVVLIYIDQVAKVMQEG